ncbi:MAG TPA: cupin domain-containing protein [Proteobacteria bacterium]|nr:cupin domain-containing protein [Pseudomonadota bacterium]
MHDPVSRPWGSYRSLLLAESYQVKEILVNPGQRLSLQSHRQRSEHWVVTAGPCLVTLGDEDLRLETGMHVYIPRNSRHRLGNPGKAIVKIIEVQIGDYLDEDDIVRYEDDYQRVPPVTTPENL